jgi:solute carrier family 35 protein C2
MEPLPSNQRAVGVGDNASTHDVQSSHSLEHNNVAASRFPQPTLTRFPSVSDISLRSDDDIWAPDAAAALAGIHPPEIKMDPQPSGHRRRRSSLMNSLDASAKHKPKNRSGKGKGKGGKNSLLEEPAQERPSLEESTSEDMELDHLSEDGLQDDEETGLTGKDKGKRKQRRRRNTLLDQRIAVENQVTAEERKEADQNVLKKSLVNALLIGLWYIFSLSISIVGFISLPTIIKNQS